MAVWDNIVGPIWGVVMELVKQDVLILLNTIVNVVVQPMLSGQTTSLNDLFGNQSPDSIAANGQSTLSNMGSNFNFQSFQLSSVGSSMQSMMSGAKTLTGAGTILEPLISMTGPGIMSTIFDIVGNTVLTSLITPLFSQFTNSSLDNMFTTITSPLGGINNTLLQVTDLISQISSFLDQSGATKQHYSTGAGAQSTGSRDPTGGSGISLNDVYLDPTSSSSSGSNQPLSQDDVLNWMLKLGNFVNNISLAILDDTSGIFAPILNIIGLILKGIDTLNSGMIDNYVLNIGLLSTFNDLLGGLKLRVAKMSFDRVIIQFIRLELSAIQSELSFQLAWSKFSSDLVHDTDIALIWVLKSGSSLVTNFLSFLNDLGNFKFTYWLKISGFLLLGAHSPMYLFTKFGTNFNEFTNWANSILVMGNFLGVVLFYFYIIGPMNAIQKGVTTTIIIALLGEDFAKFLIYSGIINDPKNLQIIYYLSAGTDLIQMIFTMADLTKI